MYNNLQERLCVETYNGETKRPLKFGLADHRDYNGNIDPTTATGQHFNSAGHTFSGLAIFGI